MLVCGLGHDVASSTVFQGSVSPDCPAPSVASVAMRRPPRLAGMCASPADVPPSDVPEPEAMPSVIRENRHDQAPEVTRVELFVDLVYVFAATQLSHRLAGHLSLRGALETLVLFLAVWWAWNSTRGR